MPMSVRWLLRSWSALCLRSMCVGSLWYGWVGADSDRGGSAYGPRWQRPALRENRPRAYEDFAAIAAARPPTTARPLLGEH
jgi:hypothetical protein